MNTYCLFYKFEEIGIFHSKVPCVSAKKICRALFKGERYAESNQIGEFTIKNKETNKIYHYSGRRELKNAIISFPNGNTIKIKYKYYVKRIQ